MNFLPWLKLEPSTIIEYFLELVRAQYWLSVVILWVALSIAVVYFGSIVATGIRQSRSLLTYFGNWSVALAVILGTSGAFALSVGMVAYLRSARLPVPSLSDLKVVFGENELLQWELPVGAGAGDLMFEVQWSTDAGFPVSQTQSALVNESLFPLTAARNETRYWRVRALELHGGSVPQRLGAWSRAVKIDQYANVLEKIKRTRRITVAMENEFGRSKFRWYEAKVDDMHGSDVLQQPLSYRGVDVEIAYAIADEACRTLLEGKSEDGRTMTCLSSRSPLPTARDADLCREKKCVRIEVRIGAIPWSEVMKSVGEGRFDLAISSITYEAERENAYNILFGTLSYEQTGYGIVSKGDGRPLPAGKRVYTETATALKGRRIGVQPGTTSHKCLRHLLDRFREAGDKNAFQIVEQNRDLVALNLLVRGKGAFDLMVKDGTTAAGWKALHGESIIVEDTPRDFFGPDAPASCSGQEYRIAVRAGEFEFQKLSDRVLARTGWIEGIKQEAAEQFALYLRASGAEPHHRLGNN